MFIGFGRWLAMSDNLSIFFFFIPSDLRRT